MRREIWDALLSCYSVKNVSYCGNGLNKRNSGPGPFDAIVIDASEKNSTLLELSKDITNAMSLLSNKGIFCISFDNKFGISRIIHRSNNKEKPIKYSLKNITAILKNAGCKQFKVYTLYPQAGEVSEIIDTNTRFTNYGDAPFLERVKIFLNKSLFTRAVHSAYLVLATTDSNSLKLCFPSTLIKHNFSDFEKIIIGKPFIFIFIYKDFVVRVPQNHLSKLRCAVNKKALLQLRQSSISGVVPRIFNGHNFTQRCYSVESRISGFAFDKAIKNLDSATEKAANFITDFHKNTCMETVINDTRMKRLFLRDSSRLANYLSDVYREKLAKIDLFLRDVLIGRSFKTVWMHGDYKIENVLFNMRSLEITGIIDWDLSRRDGLPLLDIFYLLFYSEALKTKKHLFRIFIDRFEKNEFTIIEKRIIKNYLKELHLSEELVYPMLILFIIHHISQRFSGMFYFEKTIIESWMSQYVYPCIDEILLSIENNGR